MQVRYSVRELRPWGRERREGTGSRGAAQGPPEKGKTSPERAREPSTLLARAMSSFRLLLLSHLLVLAAARAEDPVALQTFQTRQALPVSLGLLVSPTGTKNLLQVERAATRPLPTRRPKRILRRKSC